MQGIGCLVMRCFYVGVLRQVDLAHILLYIFLSLTSDKTMLLDCETYQAPHSISDLTFSC